MDEFNYQTGEEEADTNAESNPQMLSKKKGERGRCWQHIASAEQMEEFDYPTAEKDTEN